MVLFYFVDYYTIKVTIQEMAMAGSIVERLANRIPLPCLKYSNYHA